ncbi:hypothetical protein [Rhizobium sp. 18065]|uniref:hypothetical protein n=1 Tax=Rhizobium sp. 18065 TaxID=2681411 RepID=UPI001359FB04|nr:hypothetical protein [Rhizobium sp. 18065]
MKTPHQNFVVEFKSGCRQHEARSGSIWGKTDLKALVRAAEADAPHLFDPQTAHQDSITCSEAEAQSAHRDVSSDERVGLAVSDCEKPVEQD